MATVFENVRVSLLSENGDFVPKYDHNVRIEIIQDERNVCLALSNGTESLQNLDVENDADLAKVGEQGVVVSLQPHSLLLKLASPKDQTSFCFHLKEAFKKHKKSVFIERTDAASAEQYFQFYGYLSQQQNMMQDYIRTSTYQRAMLDNTVDFIDKVVMDVGAGSGILSFFAVQAGAKKVYAVEASSMAKHCETLVKNSKLGDKIQVIAGKIEEIDIPEKVDIIISEPMGYMLFNERMLETYLHAKKWLKPGGKMFPTIGDLHVAPFTDESLYMEQYSKANFWYQPSFHGIDLCSLREAAVVEYFKQPIVDTFDIRICLAKSQKHTVDFQTAHETELHNIQMPLNFTMQQSGNIHGLAFWFDVAFIGSQSTVWLSTSPTQPLTHWYQVRCMLREPLFLKQGQTLLGKVKLRANCRQSYDVDIELNIPGTNSKSSNTLDLKNPFFRYTGQQPLPPPGTNDVSPTDSYWTQQDLQQQQQTQQVQIQGNSYNIGSLLNGGMGDAQIILQQQGQSSVVNNLVPIVPVNPGSIPAPGSVSVNSAASQALQTRASVGGGVSPINFISQAQSGNPQFSVSQQFMIGDYAVPGNIQVQGLNTSQYQS